MRNDYFYLLKINLFQSNRSLCQIASMDYKKCPIIVYRKLDEYVENGQGGLDANGLVDLVRGAGRYLPLVFTRRSNPISQFVLEFTPNWKLFGDSLTAKVVRTCQFEAINPATGEYSVLSACNAEDISGLIRIGGRSYILGHSGKNLYFLVENSRSCDELEEWENARSKRELAQRSSSKLPDYYSGYTDGIKRWTELVLIADNTIFKKYGNDEKRVIDRLHSIASTVNSLYAPLNIRITLVWADIWKAENPIEVTEEADKTLRDFLTYRKTLLAEHSHDNAHLLTDVKFGSVIGKAYKGTMCSYDYSGGVIVDHSENAVFVGMTVAHEMGHNFGMDHDVEQCKCPVDSCIMAPASSNINATSFFSDCSLDTLSSAFRRGVDYCLHNVPKMAFGGAKCGNGILEDGEDCDCGSPTSCPNKCCIGCKLAREAECAEGECCDLELCKLKSMATVCRPQIGNCDLPEFCDGQNPSCPPDFFVQDGHKCPDESEDYCYQGMCGSRRQQCRFIWGPSAENSIHECYAYNEYGSFSGNCGYNQVNEQYIRCRPRDVACGRLQCVHDSDKPVFGDPSTVYSAYNYVKKEGRDEICRVARATLTGTGSSRKADPGMVPDGAECGKDSICVNAECRNKSEVLQMVSRCEPDDCNGKGICNNFGNCHCVSRYGGVGCDLPGYGGSVNSGPASVHSFNPGLVLLYSFFLALFIFVLASLYYRRKKGFWIHKKIWSKTRVTLELRSFNLVPTRRAPPPPGSQIQHTHRQSWNAVWDDPSLVARGEVLHIDASRPYAFGGARAVLKQTKPTEEKRKRKQNGEWGGGGAGAAALTTIGPLPSTKVAEERKKAAPPIWSSKKRGADEHRALVLGSDTVKSSSSDESDRQEKQKKVLPPAIPPHRSQNNGGNNPAVPPSKPKPPKKPSKITSPVMASTNVSVLADDANEDSKVDVKKLAARFERK